MIEVNEKAEQINEWVGMDANFTKEQIVTIIWAFSMDKELHQQFNNQVLHMRHEYEKEREMLV